MRKGGDLRVFSPFPIMGSMSLECFIVSARPSIRIRSIPPTPYAGTYAVISGPNPIDVQDMPRITELFRPLNKKARMARRSMPLWSSDERCQLWRHRVADSPTR